MYSDGISEALDPDNREFGTPRLRAALCDPVPNSARQAVGNAMAKLTQFTGGAPQSDDITCLALHRRR